MLRHRDAAGVHLETHALADAGGKSIRFPGPLALVPAGAPAIDRFTRSRASENYLFGSTVPWGYGRGTCGSEACGLSSHYNFHLSQRQMVSVAVKHRPTGSGINPLYKQCSLDKKSCSWLLAPLQDVQLVREGGLGTVRSSTQEAKNTTFGTSCLSSNPRRTAH